MAKCNYLITLIIVDFSKAGSDNDFTGKCYYLSKKTGRVYVGWMLGSKFNYRGQYAVKQYHSTYVGELKDDKRNGQGKETKQLLFKCLFRL